MRYPVIHLRATSWRKSTWSYPKEKSLIDFLVPEGQDTPKTFNLNTVPEIVNKYHSACSFRTNYLFTLMVGLGPKEEENRAFKHILESYTLWGKLHIKPPLSTVPGSNSSRNFSIVIIGEQMNKYSV